MRKQPTATQNRRQTSFNATRHLPTYYFIITQSYSKIPILYLLLFIVYQKIPIYYNIILLCYRYIPFYYFVSKI